MKDNPPVEEDDRPRKPYFPPVYNLETTITFMFDGIKQKDSKYTCRQCSSCHGCR